MNLIVGANSYPMTSSGGGTVWTVTVNCLASKPTAFKLHLTNPPGQSSHLSWYSVEYCCDSCGLVLSTAREIDARRGRIQSE